MEAISSPPPTGVSCAVTACAAALDGLIDTVESGELDGLDGLVLVEIMRSFERVRNRMCLVDHAVLSTAERVDLAGELTHSSLTSVLVHTLRLSPGEAARRVRAAAAVGPRVSMVGERLAPVRPRLAAVQRCGEVSAEQVAVVVRALEVVDRPGLDPVEVVWAEETLANHCLSFGPRELRRIAVHIEDAVNPDGTVGEEELVRDRRDLRLTRCSDGMFRVEGRLTPVLGVQLSAVLSPLAKPRINTTTAPDGKLVEEPDPRHYGQRMHDALEDACARLLRAGGLPVSGGTPAAVIVTIDADTLRARTGHGTSTHGTVLSVAEVLRLAGEAEVLPAVLTRSGVLLELGRSRRVANQNQTYALIARDSGCSFPSCAHPPQWCDRHHSQEWAAGGTTDLNNLTLLCRYHHTHFVGHGWTCQITRGVPAWLPPKWVDPEQRPLINDRIRANHTLAA